MEIDHDKTQQLAEKYDSEIRFRPLDKTATWIVSGLLVALSLFHYYTAGFGLLREATHRGVHLAFVLSLIFLVFGFSKSHYQRQPKSTWFAPAACRCTTGPWRSRWRCRCCTSPTSSRTWRSAWAIRCRWTC